MADDEHSPGPWRWDNSRDGHLVLRSAEEEVILCAGCPADWVPGGDDARLIAAAPELLEALQNVEATLPACTHQPGISCWHCDARALLERVSTS
jgi:hypothetical protein